MPANAANRMTIHLAKDKALRFMCQDGRKAVATAELRNTQSSGDLEVQFQRAKHALKVLFTWGGGPATGGTFKMKFGTEETAAIAWHATDQTFLNNIRTALEALDGLAAYKILVTGTPDTAFTVILNPKPGTGAHDQQANVYQHPLDQATAKHNLTVSDFASLTGVTEPTETDQTWEDVDPDGHNDKIVVKPYGKKVVAFGQGADENNADNLLGPFFRIRTLAGSGLMEFSPSDETLNIVRI